MPPFNELRVTLEGDVGALAACRIKSIILSLRSYDNPLTAVHIIESDSTYSLWHTQVNIDELCDEIKVSPQKVMRLAQNGMKSFFKTSQRSAFLRTVDEIAEPFWTRVAHPLLLVSEIQSD